MAEPTYRIKPLEWRAGHAPTPVGSYSVERRWTGEETGDEPLGSWYWSYCADEYYDECSFDCDSEADGYAAAEAHYRERLLRALEVVDE